MLHETFLHRLDLKVVLGAEVRNAIEHFDEHLDDVCIKAARGELKLPVEVHIDYVFGSRDAWRPRADRTAYLLRTYIIDERVFVTGERSVHLEGLASELLYIANAYAVFAPPTPAAFMHTITDDILKPAND